MVREPYRPHESVRSNLDRYLLENGFTWEAYEAPRTEASFLGIPFSVPNPPSHAQAIRLHDIHHVVTGFGTDLLGEAEVSAFEVASGLGGTTLYVSGLVLSGLSLGLSAPFRARHAWECGRRATMNLFRHFDRYDAFLEMPLGALRALLHVPPAGATTHERGLHARAPRS